MKSLSIVAFLCNLGMALLAEDMKQVSLPPHNFTLLEGFAIEKVAEPPLVQRPINMCFDEQGALYVTDSSGNSEKAPIQLKTPSHRILRLVDSDGDGVFDHSTVFADKVPFPEGILVFKGDVFVGAPPHIWKFTDTDGDHVADKRASWWNGGSIGSCGNDIHGPYLAPDGYFYWCKGGFQEQSIRLGSGRLHTGSAAHIFRSKPDGSQLEVIMTGGMDNPVGLAFSETGERFLCGTFFDLSQPGRRDGVLHAVYGGMYGKKHDRVLAQHPHTGRLLPILVQAGPAAPSGMVMPRNEALGFKGDLLCADFNLRRISHYQLSQSGSSYTAEEGILVESDQSDFHPTDVIEDVDGSLLIADTGSWYHICCPTSKLSKPQILGAIYRIRKKDSKSIEDPRGMDLDWQNPATSYLSDKRPYVVRRAIEALAKKGNIEALQMAKAQIPALWALHRIPGGKARKAVRDYITHSDPDLSATAMHSVGLWRDPEAVSLLSQTLASDNPLLVRIATETLGRIGDRRAVKALLTVNRYERDPFLKHAVTYALFEIGDYSKIPEDHSLAAQLERMREIAQTNPAPGARPEIQLAKQVDLDPKKLAKQQERLKELITYLPKGNEKRGKELFNNPAKSMCILCHVKGDQGTHFGPDLTKIGAIRTKLDLLEAIVYPSASIAPYYEMVNVETETEEKVGLLIKDGVDKLVLSATPGSEQSILLSDIKSATYSNTSLMPQVFDGLLKPEELADLIAYLSQAK